MLRIGALLVICFVLFSCKDEPKKKVEVDFKSEKEYQDLMILSHQEFLKKESEKIEGYIDSTKLPFIKTGTGLRYHVLNETEGDSIETGEIAIITYSLMSIDGDSLYQSPEGKFQEFMVGYDDVETGLHEGIQHLRVGEKAIFILPAHLGHGITGDQAAIPTQTTLVYHLYFAAKK